MAGFSSNDLLDQPDGIASPIFQSTLLHGLVVGLLVGYGYMHNLFHGSEWGANAFQQGLIVNCTHDSVIRMLEKDGWKVERE